MTEDMEGVRPPEIKIASEISELPKLPEDYVRVVHITAPEAKDSLLDKGLIYERHGMAASMASAWGKEEEVQFWSDDRRFSFEGAKALVMDIPNEEWKLHNDVTKSSGIIPKESIVGFVDAKKPSS